MLGADGISDFNAPHSRKHDEQVQFCAFDMAFDMAVDFLDEGSDHLRALPPHVAKAS